MNRGRPRRDDLVRDISAQIGLTPDKTRKSYILKIDKVKTIEDIAYWERKYVYETLDELLEAGIQKHLFGKGRWDEEGTYASRLKLYRCNRCHELNTQPSNYCPNCGAQMEALNATTDD